MIEEAEHPATGQQVYEVACDGNPGCPEAMYWARTQGLKTLLVALFRYGWEIREKSHRPYIVEVYCPAHAVNPPPSPTFNLSVRDTVPYGPGSEDYVMPI